MAIGAFEFPIGPVSNLVPSKTDPIEEFHIALVTGHVLLVHMDFSLVNYDFSSDPVLVAADTARRYLDTVRLVLVHSQVSSRKLQVTVGAFLRSVIVLFVEFQ